MGNVIIKPKRVCDQHPEIIKEIISAKNLVAINTRRQARNDYTLSPNSEDISSTNPFFVFYLRLSRAKPGVPVTKLAKVAGRRWRAMSSYQKDKYLKLAEIEKRRRKELSKMSEKTVGLKKSGRQRKGVAKRGR